MVETPTAVVASAGGSSSIAKLCYALPFGAVVATEKRTIALKAMADNSSAAG